MNSIRPKCFYSFFILCFFFSLQGFSQINLNGRVEDATTHQLLEHASVYFNNTTIATYTDKQGNFSFENLRMVTNEMVVFCPGYELLVFKPSEENIKGKKVVFRLKPSIDVTDKLIVDNESKTQVVGLLKELLLGVTIEVIDCKVLNEDAVYFLQGESKTQFIVMADTPLIIINKKLGYKISYNIVECWFDNLTGENMTLGFARYDEVANPKRYSDSRQEVYQGTTLHFYRSLVNHQLYQQGFEAYLMKPVKDLKLLKTRPKNLLVTELDTALLEPVSPQALLYIDSTNEMSVRLNNKLLVYFSKDPTGKNYMIANGTTEGFALKGFQSYIIFLKPSIGISYKGVLEDYDAMKYSGYWIYEKLANKLPLNYEPDN